MTRSLFALCAAFLALSGCQEAARPGVGYLHVTELPGACPVTQPLIDWPMACPDDNRKCAVTALTTLPFERQRAASAFQGGSRWPGGNLIASGWQTADGTIGRMQVDLGPTRGYGPSVFPWTDPEGREVQQSIGYNEWKDGQRRFAATKVVSGLLEFYQDDSLGVHRGRDTHEQHLFALIAFDGVGPAGEAQCRIVGLHAMRDYDRFLPYDPTWLAPDPTGHLVNGAAPTFAAETAPTANLIEPAGAPADPGGEMPFIDSGSNFVPQGYYRTGAASGGCD